MACRPPIVPMYTVRVRAPFFLTAVLPYAAVPGVVALSRLRGICAPRVGKCRAICSLSCNFAADFSPCVHAFLLHKDKTETGRKQRGDHAEKQGDAV